MRTAIGFLLRIYSYVYHLMLSLFFVGIAVLANSAGKDLKLGSLLPWEGAQLNHWVLGLGICGIAMVLLSVRGILRPLFPLWTLLVFVLMARGFFATGYSFGGEDAFKGAVHLTIGALGAFLSSLTVLKRRS